MKIGKRVKAKKYRNLREKQKQANAIIQNAKGFLKEDNRAIKKTKAKIKTFYNERGIKTPSRLSFKSLQTKDLKAYENLLDSIIQDKSLSKAEHERKQKQARENLKTAFGKSDEDINDETIDDFINIMESDIISELIEKGLEPSDLIRVEIEYLNNGLSTDDFYNMLTDFYHALGEDAVISDFYVYAEKWQTIKGAFNDFVNMGKYDGSEFDEFRDENINKDIEELREQFLY